MRRILLCCFLLGTASAQIRAIDLTNLIASPQQFNPTSTEDMMFFGPSSPGKTWEWSAGGSFFSDLILVKSDDDAKSWAILFDSTDANVNLLGSELTRLARVYNQNSGISIEIYEIMNGPLKGNFASQYKSANGKYSTVIESLNFAKSYEDDIANEKDFSKIVRIDPIAAYVLRNTQFCAFKGVECGASMPLGMQSANQAATNKEFSLTVGAANLDGMLLIMGNVNLPDNTLLEWQIQNDIEELGKSTQAGYAKVKNGGYEAVVDISGWKGKAITVTVTFKAVPDDHRLIQPDETLALVGKSGELLSGSNVSYIGNTKVMQVTTVVKF